MKAVIELDDLYGFDDESISEIFRNAIHDEIRASAKRIAKDAIKKVEAEAKKAVDKAVKKDWKKISVLIEQLQKED